MTLDDLLSNPPREFSPTPLWWWSGERVTRERLRWQLEKFASGGIYAVVVINLAPAGPIVGARADEPAWFSEEWWDCFRYACEVATELNMRIWFYDQIGFSGANVQGRITLRDERCVGQSLRLHRTVVAGGTPHIPAEETLLAAFTEDGRRVRQADDDQLDLADGTALNCVTTVATAFDYLDPHACALLIDSVHGEFQRRVGDYLGNVIAGSFQDELPPTNTWSRRFAAEFQRRKGYDLTDELCALWESGDRAGKIRGDYYDVRRQLAEESFFRPLGEWHAAHGMLIGSDQSNPARAGNPTQATQIYTDYFRTHRWFSAAGSDHEGDAKLHSSLAHLYGHERVWIESFHSSGWGGTLEETWDWLIPFLRSGANLYNPHAAYYSTRAGWFEWAPPSTDWRQPYWAVYPEFSEAVRRVASVCSWGTFVTSTGVLHPTANAQALTPLDLPIDHFGSGTGNAGLEPLDSAQEAYLSLVGSNNWFHTRPGELDKCGISFDVIDDDSLQRASVVPGALRLGRALYRCIVVPDVTVLEDDTAQALLDLLDAGGRVVIVGRNPRLASGLGGDDATVRRLAEHPQIERVSDPRAAAAEVGPADEYVHSDVPLLTRRDQDEVVTLVPGAFPSATAFPIREWGGPWRWGDIDFNCARYARRRALRVSGPISDVYAIDAATGLSLNADVAVDANESSLILIDTNGSPAILVRWKVRVGTDGSRQDRVEHLLPPVELDRRTLANWHGELIPTLDNRWGDFSLPAGTGVSELQIAEIEVEEDHTWLPGRAGLGEQVLVRIDELGQVEPLSPHDVFEVCTGARDLVAPGWDVHEYSASTGRARDPGVLGNKGYVPEEFLRFRAPGEGQVGVVRTLVSVAPGPYDLVVSSSAPKVVYWNGQKVGGGSRYSAIVPVAAQPVNLLEYHLTESVARGDRFLDTYPTVGSAFLLVERSGFGSRPEFMTVDGPTHSRTTEFSRAFTVPSEALSARLVVGAATRVNVRLDGVSVARQEKVEYYETSMNATPMFFEHDVRDLLRPGDHIISVEVESDSTQIAVFVDLVINTTTGPLVIASGDGWGVEAGGGRSLSRETVAYSDERISAHAAVRTHPLRGAEWLNGPVSIGVAAAAIHASIALEPDRGRVRATLPAGTSRITTRDARFHGAAIDGHPVSVEKGVVQIEPPLVQPCAIELITDGRRGGALQGPLNVQVEPGRISLGDWATIGLGSWSGAVKYSMVVELDPNATYHLLDLGQVRGGVEVRINSELVGRRFCAPWRFKLPEVAGPVELSVTVYNTLGPYLHSNSPTAWVFPSQLSSGLFGPVELVSVA